MTPSKNNGLKNKVIQVSIAIIFGLVGTLFGTIVWPAIQKNTEELKVLKDLHQTDYAELSLGQQAIRLDIAAVARERQLMDSLILDKLDKLLED